MNLVLCAFLCILLFFIYSKITKKHPLDKYARQFPMPLSLPLIGHLYMIIGGPKAIVKVHLSLAKRHFRRGIMTFWIGFSLCFMSLDTEILEKVLNNFLEKNRLVYGFAAKTFGDGLVTARVDKWRRHRKVMAPSFQIRKLNGFIDNFAKFSRDINEELRGKSGTGLFEIFPVIRKFTLYMVCVTTMGTLTEGMEGSTKFAGWADRLTHLLTKRCCKPWLYLDIFWRMTSESKEFEELHKKIRNYVQKIIETKRAHPRPISEDNKDNVMLDHLIELTNTENWTEDELIDEVQTIINTGSDSTSFTVGFALIMLAMHQDLQAKVYQEIESVFGKNPSRTPTADDLKQLNYLEQFIKETLRVFPTIPHVARYIHKDIQFDDKIIPGGTNFIVSTISLHRNPDLWPNPLVFDPDRFLPEEMKKRHPYSYLPFSAGPRNCIGMNYAMISMKVMLCTILRQYKIADTNFKDIKDMKLKAGIALRCTEREKIAIEERF